MNWISSVTMENTFPVALSVNVCGDSKPDTAVTTNSFMGSPFIGIGVEELPFSDDCGTPPNERGRMTTPTMTIDGVEYVEAPEPEIAICDECALGKLGMLAQCSEALRDASHAAFGGNCIDRRVIYLRKA